MRNKISKREPTGNSLHVRPFENETRAGECSYVKIDFLLPNLISISRPRQPLNSSREIAFYRTLFTAYSPLDVTSQNSISKEGIFITFLLDGLSEVCCILAEKLFFLHFGETFSAVH